MEGGEAIMICIDTSCWMDNYESTRFKDQADAVRLYCTEKFKSHPETVVGICGMSYKCITHLCAPTRWIGQIMASLYYANTCGQLMLIEAVVNAHDVWFGYSGKERGVHLPKRITVFAGGPVYDKMKGVRSLGKVLKERNIACDAISFGDPASNKKELFDALIDAADNNGNCNLLHVPPASTVLDALSRSQILRTGSAPLASLPVQQNKLVDPHDHPAKINAVSQSVVHLNPENLKPETLDQRIEMAKRELESLIMQKNKLVALPAGCNPDALSFFR